MKGINIDKKFFIACAAGAIYFIISMMRLPGNDSDGIIVICFAMILLVLPFIIPKSMLKVEKDG